MLAGHQEIKSYFVKIIEEKRVPHALLMLGPEGSGQLEITLELCKMLFCINPKGGLPCNSCKTCHKIATFVHPDIHFAFPVIKHDKFKREETTSTHFLKEWRQFMTDQIHGNITDWLKAIGGSNKNGNINVAECHQIIHNLGLKSYEGKYKIQIIWHAESLAKEGNRLLKLIEEPSDDTIIILIANNHNAILNTIQSRCQILRIPAFSDNAIEDHIRGKFDLSEQKIKEIGYLAEGNMRKAEELIGSGQINFSTDMLEWFRKSYMCDPDELVAWVDYLNSLGKENLKSFMRYTLHFLREYLLAYSFKTTDNLKLSDEEKAVIIKMQKILDRNKADQLNYLFNKNIGYISRNLSMKIMLMNMTFKINEILRAEVNRFV